MTDSLQDVVSEMRRLTDATHEHGSIDAASVREWADRLSVLAAPVAPEWFDEQCAEFLRVAFRHNDISGLIDFNDIRMGIKRANALSTGRSGEVDRG